MKGKLLNWASALIALFGVGGCHAHSPTSGALDPVKPCATAKNAISNSSKAGIFIVGGIHQGHDKARTYTYQRMGEIYQHLHPDVLGVEVEQKYLDDGSEHGMPYDFAKFMVPLAKKDHIPIIGIDWWDKEKGEKWKKLQNLAGDDSRFEAEANLIGGMFKLLNDYFEQKDFVEINGPEVTDLWAAKNLLKYNMFNQYPEYRFITEFEKERNERMVENIVRAASQYPDKRILIGVGIDHKSYLERALRSRGLRVLNVCEVIGEWWR